MAKLLNKPRWQACNVLNLAPTGPRLWQVSVAGGKFSLLGNKALEGAAAVQPKVVAKDWNEILHPRLNIALLPPSQVFVRVVQLPKAEDPAETTSMIELQLEKLSPLPVAQVVWTYELVPNRGLSETQTVILVVVARQLVEDLLGKLEAHGYLADRIELSFLDQILALEVNRDCVLLFPAGEVGEVSVLWAAWWYGGCLRCLGQIHVPSGSEPAGVLKAQLGQMAWAGELEGWLAASPRHFLVAEGEVADRWMAALQGKFDPPIEVVPAATEQTLASFTAKRAAQPEAKVPLLPADYSSRYRQQFVDKLWMQGLFGLLALYLFGLLIYFGVVAVKGYQRDSLVSQEIAMGSSYTNALRIKDQVRVLQEQINLQFAALNCYLVAATNLPPELTLGMLSFDRTKLTLSGGGGPEAAPRVFDFNGALKLSRVKDQPMFKSVEGPSVNLKAGGAEIFWSFVCELRRAELE